MIKYEILSQKGFTEMQIPREQGRGDCCKQKTETSWSSSLLRFGHMINTVASTAFGAARVDNTAHSEPPKQLVSLSKVSTHDEEM